LTSPENNVFYSLKNIEFQENRFPKRIDIILYIPAAVSFYPSMVAVDGHSVCTMGAEVKVLGENNGYSKIIVGIDITKCEHLMKNDSNWRLADISGPKITLNKNQKFIPLIFFAHCMIGVSVGEDIIKDQIIVKWLEDYEDKQSKDEKAYPTTNTIDGVPTNKH
jgi:hypothetical protein